VALRAFVPITAAGQRGISTPLPLAHLHIKKLFQAVEKRFSVRFLSFPRKRESSLFNILMDARLRGHDMLGENYDIFDNQLMIFYIIEAVILVKKRIRVISCRGGQPFP
jgi:hypothetical protein